MHRGFLHPILRSLPGALLLGLFLFLNLAAVCPALHELGHDSDGCDESGCVVLTVAAGQMDPGLAWDYPGVPAFSGEINRIPHSPGFIDRTDCPLLPGRAPPC